MPIMLLAPSVVSVLYAYNVAIARDDDADARRVSVLLAKMTVPINHIERDLRNQVRSK